MFYFIRNDNSNQASISKPNNCSCKHKSKKCEHKLILKTNLKISFRAYNLMTKSITRSLNIVGI